MKTRNAALLIILAISFVFLPAVYAEPSVTIIMEKTTYSYCEKLFYIIEVSEITGESAIIHIRDETGKGSSAIPIEIKNLQNPVPALFPFEKDSGFALGKYFIDVEYSGSEFTAEFNLIDSDNICIPEVIKPILTNWLTGNISDGFLMDAFQKYVDKEIIDIPFEINENNVYEIDIPDWVKNVGYWWIEGTILDEDFAQVVNYLIEKKIISLPIETENEI
ncbi:MAG: hypothetical protein IH792_03040 [Thaumarchaeota archaeon]|nr:hypothetical protein [Nitrososphaerota archaeon]